MPQTLPAGLNDFVDAVMPELQRRGLFRTKYEGRTLRENVGLPRPENRFVAAARGGVRTPSFRDACCFGPNPDKAEAWPGSVRRFAAPGMTGYVSTTR